MRTLPVYVLAKLHKAASTNASVRIAQDVLWFTEQWRWTLSLMKNESLGVKRKRTRKFLLIFINITWNLHIPQRMVFFDCLSSVLYACKLRRFCCCYTTLQAAVGNRVLWTTCTQYSVDTLHTVLCGQLTHSTLWTTYTQYSVDNLHTVLCGQLAHSTLWTTCTQYSVDNLHTVLCGQLTHSTLIRSTSYPEVRGLPSNVPITRFPFP
jgi:hypothetical protein